VGVDVLIVQTGHQILLQGFFADTTELSLLLWQKLGVCLF